MHFSALNTLKHIESCRSKLGPCKENAQLLTDTFKCLFATAKTPQNLSLLLRYQHHY